MFADCNARLCLMQGKQARVGQYYSADAMVKLPASGDPAAGEAVLVIESNGAVWHGDARHSQHLGHQFYDYGVHGACSSQHLRLGPVGTLHRWE